MARTVRLLGVLLIVLSCVACRVDVNVDVAMDEDGSGVITLTVTADADIVARAPTLADDLRFTDLTAVGWEVDGPNATQSGGLQAVLTRDFATPAQGTAILAELNGPTGPLQAITLGRTRVEDVTTYTLSGALQIAGGIDAFADPELIAAVGATPYAGEIVASGITPADTVGVVFTASIPGSVQTTTALRDDDLSWLVPFDTAAVDVSTTSRITDERNVWAGPVATGAKIALIAWIILAVGFIAFVLIARTRVRRSRLRRF